MAFFDELSKKVSQVGQTTLQKTKEMADIAKLKSSIAEEEKNMDNLYIQIGKLYAEQYAEEEKDLFKDSIQAISESRKRIAELQFQIQQIKGVIYCRNCGAEIPSNTIFCGVCGAKIENVQSEETSVTESLDANQTSDTEEASVSGNVEMSGTIKKSCSSCGKEVAPDAVFCSECGSKIE